MQHPLINIAVKAARSASKIILRAVDRLDSVKVSEKGQNDYVTEIDQQAEQEIINIIHDVYPEHAILGEESGKSGAGECVWIIDPIDGTTNFIHGCPHFCISIGIQVKGIIEHGVIYDPLRQELFMATRGSGAFLNDRRIRVTQRKQLVGSVIGACFGPKTIKHLNCYLGVLATLLPQTAGTRHGGSTALDFAYVASGRLDGVWGINYAPWDIAAGSLIVKEAGGIVGDFNNKEDYIKTGNVIAGNINIYNLLFEIINNNYK
jgi:myo-inositol-1(or 4)-monophosphatase